MPSTLPSSFASAAAGNSDPSSSRNIRDPSTYGEWSRRPNGATQTFRRTSTATTGANQVQQRETGLNNGGGSTQSVGAYVPPHISASRNGPTPDLRYSRTQLLDLYREQKESGDLNIGLSELYVGDTDPGPSNGVPSNRWGRREEQKYDSAAAPEACWDRAGDFEPLALVDLSIEEKELFTSSVNSLIKSSNGPGGRENNQRETTSNRKASISQGHGTPHTYGTASPTTARPPHRRREPSESYPFPRDSAAPASTGSKPLRDEPAAANLSLGLFRRKTDLKDSEPDSAVDEREDGYPIGNTQGIGTTFGTVKRNTLGPLSAGLNGPSSPWAAAPQSSGFSPGAFGNFGIGGISSSGFVSGEKHSGPASSRNESRFRGLMTKSSVEDENLLLRERAPLGGLARQNMPEMRRKTPEQGGEGINESNAQEKSYSETETSFGSAALGGRHDDSPRDLPDYGSLGGQKYSEDDAFPAFETRPEQMAFRAAGDRYGQSTMRGPQSSRYDQSGNRMQEPMSPTYTNPYQSPHQQSSELRELDAEDMGMESFHLPGLGAIQNAAEQGPHPSVRADSRDTNCVPPFDNRHFDRGPMPSGPASRVFTSLGGLGGLAGLGNPGPWSNSLAVGTPTRANFSDIFAEQRVRTPGEAPSPSIGSHAGNNAFGAVGNFGPSGSGTIGRGSKLGSLFPPAMQEQMRAGEHAGHERDDDGFRHEYEGLDDGLVISTNSTIDGITGLRRDAESPFRSGRGKFDDFFGSAEKGQAFRAPEVSYPTDQATLGSQYSPATMQTPIQPPIHQSSFPPQPQSGQRVASIGSSGSSQPPAAQQKTMVMPDRIRWIYRDPQGNTQGPWSGLEMHDWYRAGFFSPELLVKKAEDADYEPLAQLIRRIGNSREPFLVPQIGIPGPPSSQAGTNWPSQNVAASPPNAASAAQPPFAGSFPSFGTTLTADQQNALERRKQEEQYLMARQKEHLAQQQVLVKQMQLQGQHGILPQQLQHQQSAQSLNSQPSYGSMTSPSAFQASPIQSLNHISQGLPGAYDSSFRAGGGSGIGPIGSGVDTLGHIREEGAPGVFDVGNISRDAQVTALVGQGAVSKTQYEDTSASDQRIATMLSDRARLEREQAEGGLSQDQEQGYQPLRNQRLQDFHDLRRQFESEQLTEADGILPDNLRHMTQEMYWADTQATSIRDVDGRNEEGPNHFRDASQTQYRSLSLTEQVQKAASAKQSPLSAAQSPWARVPTGIVQTTPPPQSSSPLPAPAARRNRQNVADALTAESVSQSHSPSVETLTAASVAPWAREPLESQKQPSLREIQEAEARRAAKQEELAAAVRRAQFEKELAIPAPPPAPGLPSSSTWASTESPLTASAASTAWVKPTVGKSVPAGNSTLKKTVQQIIQEEEAIARKKKALAAATVAPVPGSTSGAAQILSSGKRYADLASKAASTTPAPPSAWTTVGASGKAKVPSIPSGPPAPAARSAPSTAAVPSVPAAARPKTTAAPPKTSLATAQLNAHEEFRKWAVAELKPDLSKDIQVEDFVQNLLNFPSDTDLITEAVHMSSRTVDSRHFAEEFIRRRGLAEKGKAEPAISAAVPTINTSEVKGGGWSEVARKGSGSGIQKDESTSFKIVAAKKKGSKR